MSRPVATITTPPIADTKSDLEISEIQSLEQLSDLLIHEIGCVKNFLIFLKHYKPDSSEMESFLESILKEHFKGKFFSPNNKTKKSNRLAASVTFLTKQASDSLKLYQEFLAALEKPQEEILFFACYRRLILERSDFDDLLKEQRVFDTDKLKKFFPRIAIIMLAKKAIHRYLTEAEKAFFESSTYQYLKDTSVCRVKMSFPGINSFLDLIFPMAKKAKEMEFFVEKKKIPYPKELANIASAITGVVEEFQKKHNLVMILTKTYSVIPPAFTSTMYKVFFAMYNLNRKREALSLQLDFLKDELETKEALNRIELQIEAKIQQLLTLETSQTPQSKQKEEIKISVLEDKKVSLQARLKKIQRWKETVENKRKEKAEKLSRRRQALQYLQSSAKNTLKQAKVAKTEKVLNRLCALPLKHRHVITHILNNQPHLINVKAFNMTMQALGGNVNSTKNGCSIYLKEFSLIFTYHPKHKTNILDSVHGIKDFFHNLDITDKRIDAYAVKHKPLSPLAPTITPAYTSAYTSASASASKETKKPSLSSNKTKKKKNKKKKPLPPRL